MGVKIGCCGFPVSRSRYFEIFDVVELQQTFYQLPRPSTAVKWREQSPEGFEYTIKAWQLITHEPKSPTYRRLKIKIPPTAEKKYGSFKPTDELMWAWERTKEITDLLKARIIVFQCPPSFTPTEENRRNLRHFFSSIERSTYSFAWEPRGSWTAEEIEGICRELDLVHVVDPFKSKATHGSIRYYRLHGIDGYSYRYTKQDLLKLRDVGSMERGTYCLFNNISMFDDAREFRKLVEES
jgi:uncharacterized protein YecE (DUF72 family)